MKLVMQVFKSVCVLAFGFVLAACDKQDDKAPANKTKASITEELPTKNSSDLRDLDSDLDSLVEQALVGSRFDESSAPLKVLYKAEIDRVLNTGKPVLTLDGLEDDEQITAQELVLNDPQVAKIFFHPSTGDSLRNEVMSVKRALPGDRLGAAQACDLNNCYRVDIYNFFYNVTVTGIVDVLSKKVVSINSIPETQPDLSPRLEKLAEAIAKHEKLVQDEVARYLKTIEPADAIIEPKPVMVSTKSALKNSLCERSRHLCVAPTYVLGKQALWVIVDLTDFRVAGVRWTTVGTSNVNQASQIVTERTLENEHVFKKYCQKKTPIERNGWSLNYHLTTSDGLRVEAVKYKDKHVLESAKVVDWHVSYSSYDGFGYSDATGCPMFSSAVVVAYDGPSIEPIMEEGIEVGFSVRQDFRQQSWPAPCNYRYEERYDFYNDGRYRIALANHGRGCGINGTYRPVLRLEYGRPDPKSSYSLAAWNEKRWVPLSKEAWSKQPDEAELESRKYSHRILEEDGSGYLMLPSSGAFNDGGRGDNAYIYATVKHVDKDEGSSDLVTMGSCCNTDHQQGPEQFMQPAESLEGEALVLWYVPQMENDNTDGAKYCWADEEVVDGVRSTKTWPCTSGPMFVPIMSSGE